MAFIKHLPDDSVSLEGVFRLNSSFLTKADGSEPFSGNQSMGGFQLTNLGTPVAGTSAANKDYVDNFVQGLAWKAACRAATTANIALSGLLVLDGVTLVANDRVLVKNQTLPQENGIYAAAAGAWARTADANTAEALESAAVAVKEGLTNADTRWTQTNDNFTIGVDPVTWVFIGAGAGVVAATFVVSPTPNVGDYTDIQSALNALPVAGGLIFVREGTYSIALTLTVPNKPIVIRGCGRGATVIDIGANAIAAFTFPSANKYGLSNLTVQGSGGVSQIGLSVTGGFGCEILVSGVAITAIEKPIYTPATFVLKTTDCHFTVPNLATAYFCDGAAIWYAANTDCDHSGVARGGFLNETELHWSNSKAYLTNGGTVGWVYANNCSFFDGPLTIPAYAAGSIISACLFEASGGGPTRYIDIVAGADNLTVTGCVFGSFSSEAVRVASVSCVVAGNTNCKVTELGAANFNKYSANVGFTNSTILGVNSAVEGIARISTGGATSGAFTQVASAANPQGVRAIGTIKNTGANSMEVRESVIDQFGVSDSVTTPVLAGADLMLDPDTNVDTARPPYTSYLVEVRHPGAATSYAIRFSYNTGTSL